MRLTAFLTHPSQYFSPWFRYIHETVPELQLTVIYVATPTATQLGAEFGEPVTWGLPLREGYSSQVLRPNWSGPSLDATRAWHLSASGIGRAITATAPDIGMITGWHSWAQVRALYAFRRRGVPVVYRGDTTLQSMASGLARHLSRARAQFLLRRFSAYLSVGQRSHEYLTAMHVAPDRIFPAPHAVDNERFTSASAAWRRPEDRQRSRTALGIDTTFAVLLVGKLAPVKRPLDVVRAVAELDRDDITLMVAGGGPLADDVRATAQRYGVRLRMLGFVDQRELPRIYAAADVLAMPSDSETWGLVVNEALACGLPCIVSRTVGSAPDLVVDNVTGHVVSTGDVPALAAAIARVFGRASAGSPYTEACIRHVQAYSYARAARGLVAACHFASQQHARGSMASER